MNCRDLKEIYSLILLTTFFFFYYWFQSPFLDDFDSINFALALTDFNLMEAQPHPPGYPVYILLARSIRPLFSSDAAALVFISVAGGAIGVTVFFQIACKWLTPGLAVVAASLLGMSVGWALDSLKALTDVPGMSLCLFLFWRIASLSDPPRSKETFFLGVIAGFSSGLRLHILPLVTVFFWQQSKSRRILRSPFLVGATVGFAAWVIPTIAISGPRLFLMSHWKMMSARWGIASWSVLGTAPSLGQYTRRLIEFIERFVSEGLGYSWSDTSVAGILCGAVFLTLLYVIARYPLPENKNTRSYRTFESSYLWAAGIYSLIVFVYLPPTNARYLLCWIPLMVLAAAVRKPAFALWTFLLISLIPNTWHLARVLQTVPPAPQQLINHLRQMDLVTVKNVFIISSRYFAYYPVNAEIRLSRLTSCTEMKELVQSGAQVWAEEWRLCPGLDFLNELSFQREKRVHYKANYIDFFRLRAIKPTPTTIPTAPKTGRIEKGSSGIVAGF